MIGVAKIGTRASRGGGGAPSVNPDFVSTWNVASDGETVTLPLLSGGVYSGTIDWGDGGATSSLSYANRAHVYTTSGTYTITISGSDIQGFRFANGGDKLKITDISNFGNLTITTNQAFYGCTNLFVSATDSPSITTTSVYRMFMLAINANPLLTGIDFSSVTNFQDYAWGASPYVTGRSQFDNVGVSSYDMSSATKIRNMFRWGTLDQDLSGWDISNVTDAINFMEGSSGLSTANYDALLIGWAAQSVQTGVTIHFGGSQFTSGGAAEAAKTTLQTTYSWIITDGGSV
jgi:hypothetical protein